MVLTKKAKCQGCKALVIGKNKIECKLGFPVDFEVVNKETVKPKPLDRCYKPRSTDEFKKAQELINKKEKS